MHVTSFAFTLSISVLLDASSMEDPIVVVCSCRQRALGDAVG